MAPRTRDMITEKKPTTRRTPSKGNGVKAIKPVSDIKPVTDGNGGGARTIGTAEKLLLGMAPTDTVMTVPPALRGMIRMDGSAARLEVVHAFLERNPELRVELEREAEETWKRVGGKREEFAAAVAERRAQLLTRAQLSNLDEAAPAAMENTFKELARYLAEMYGVSGAG